jgi:hypothetical protein
MAWDSNWAPEPEPHGRRSWVERGLAIAGGAVKRTPAIAATDAMKNTAEINLLMIVFLQWT